MRPEQNAQPGTGSAENKAEDRSAQMNKVAHLPEEEKQDIAGQIDEPRESVSTLDDLGVLSGRDDQSGGSNDRMEQEDTGKPTDR